MPHKSWDVLNSSSGIPTLGRHHHVSIEQKLHVGASSGKDLNIDKILLRDAMGDGHVGFGRFDHTKRTVVRDGSGRDRRKNATSSAAAAAASAATAASEPERASLWSYVPVLRLIS
eukprot:TRINITY_DN14986_c0_g2_i1.p2 TRINITY_DN14986_c0_g2~~TRINITY_DN14986_c0_g2_i1.p2  ORF type:complete len:116 (+),score=17.57 TRINITY_DN14986_c0_g2_i1:121-468(+)